MSSNIDNIKKAVATVSKKGIICGKKAGTAVITASYKGKKAKITVKVVAPKQSITVSGKTAKVSNKAMTLIQGKKESLVTTLKTKRSKITTTTLKPTQVKWTTSNKNIVTVNNKGVVVAKKVGTAYITATYKKLKYKFKISVKKKPSTPTTPTTPSPASSSGHWEEQVVGYQYACNCGACFSSEAEINQHQFEASLNGQQGHTGVDSIAITERVWVED